MYRNHRIVIIMPALNEEQALPFVLNDVPLWIDQVIVVDNGSTDQTVEVSNAYGACVVSESKRGYGQACLSGFRQVRDKDIVVFLDADNSSDPKEIEQLLDSLIDRKADLVIGSRVLGECEVGAMPLHQQFGNWLTMAIINLVSPIKFTDLGPLRCMKMDAIDQLAMQDKDYGWNVEMQLKAAYLGMHIVETPVSFRRRIGQSKISGNIFNSLVAGFKMNLKSIRICFQFS